MTTKEGLAAQSAPIVAWILEDDPAAAEMIAAVLNKAAAFVSIEVLDSRAQFEERLREGEPDLIVSDHNMNTWTGMDALEALRQSGKEIPFIVTTATLGDEAAAHYIKSGAWDYVLKQRLERLPVSVGRVLREKRHRAERVRLQEQVVHAEEEYRSIVEEAPYGIFMVSADGRILRANPAMAEMLGYHSEEELLRLNTRELYWNADEQASLERQWRLTEQVHSWEAAWKTKEGKRIQVLMAGGRICSPAGAEPAYKIFVQDVTRQRVLEEQFRQAQKMEAVGRLAGGVAHDFNNLIMIINSYAELLLHKLGPQSPDRRYPEQIIAAGHRAAALTRQLLAFSRKQVLRLAPLDVNAVVQDLEQMLARLIGEDVRLQVTLGKNVAMIHADKGALEQVLMNLAANSRDAMPEGGTLTIETANVNLDDAFCRTNQIATGGDYVQLVVSDTGAGMDRETLSHIFEPFFTTKEQGKGTGLGLSTVYGIVKQCGGSIWAYSEPGLGTIFRIYFPVAAQGVASIQPIDVRKDVLPSGSETILLVEDEVALRQSTRDSLESLGYQVVEAANGEDALAVAKTFQGTIHLLVTDVVMPGINGKVLSERISATHPGIPVLFMSGYTNNVIAEGGLVSANQAFLQKPFGLGDLSRTVRQLLNNKEKAVSSAAAR